MLVDSAFIAFVARMPLSKALKYALNGAFSDSTIKLAVILFLIMMMEYIMRNTGMIRSMTDSLKELAGSKRLAASLLPFVIGLLPSPGGARFSCPMVEEVVGDNADGPEKAFINYWFRHIWLDSFILYPGIILAAELLKVSVVSLFLRLAPFMLASIVLGTIFGLTHIKKEKIKRTKPVRESLKTFIIALLPIILVITVYISLINVTAFPLEIASGSMVVVLLIIKKYTFKEMVKAAREAFPVKLILLIIGVMVFKEILLGSGGIISLSGLLETCGIPVAVLYLLLPFIGGLTSGLSISFVSLTFPILISLGLGSNIWFAVIAYLAGFMGNMVTPLHLCAVMTADYFKTPLGGMLKRVAVTIIPLFLAAAAVLFILAR